MTSRTRAPPPPAPNTVVLLAAAELMRIAGAVWLVGELVLHHVLAGEEDSVARPSTWR